jgi:TonB family protein
MTAAQARAAADVIGVDVLVLLKAETLRRSSLERPEYYESYAVLFVIDGRSGLLADWRSGSVDAPTAAAAETTMLQRVPAGLGEVVVSLFDPSAFDRVRPKMEEISGDSDMPGLKPPIPYKRIKPEYPRTAYLYNVRATVEIEADIDETGKVTRTSVVRWAGFGLDAAVTDAVRAMNWRPAMRGGKPLPMRVLLRYNFTKVEKE